MVDISCSGQVELKNQEREKEFNPELIVSFQMVFAGLRALPDWIDDPADQADENLGILVQNIYLAMTNQKLSEENRQATTEIER